MKWAPGTQLLRSGSRCLLVNEARRISVSLAGERARVFREWWLGAAPHPASRTSSAALASELERELRVSGLLLPED